MSLIHFCGQAILPPLIEGANDSADLRAEEKSTTALEREEEHLLSEPAHEALSFLLPGFIGDINFNLDYSFSPRVNVDTCNESQEGMKMANKKEIPTLLTNTDQCNNNEQISSEMPVPGDGTQKVYLLAEQKDSPVDSITSGSVSDIESGICSDSVNAGDTQSARSDIRLDMDTDVVEQSPGSGAYLEDYLSLLTNRSCYNLYGSMEKKSDEGTSPEGSDLSPTDSVKRAIRKGRKRTSSGSSDKSVRSVGSAYMDGYLGQLTDQSWIVFPTENNPLAKSSHDVQKFELNSQTSAGTPDTQNMQRKLQFLNPDSFFNKSSSVMRSTSIPNLLLNYGSTNVTESPLLQDHSSVTDINSSIFDKDYDDSMFDESFKSFASSNRDFSMDESSVSTVVNGLDYRPSEDTTSVQDHCTVSDLQEGATDETGSGNAVPGTTNYMNNLSTLEDSYNTDYLGRQCDTEGNEIQQMPVELTDVSHCPQDDRIYEVNDMSDSRLDAYVTVNCTANFEQLPNEDTILNNETSNEDAQLVHQKMLEFLQAKHRKELQILRRRHEEEIQQLNGNFHKLSFEQMKELESYIRKNDSMENLFEIYTHLTEEEEEAHTDTDVQPRNTCLSGSTSMPSFFLHDDKINVPYDKISAELTNSDRISKLFSPSRSPQLSASTNMSVLFGQQPISQSGPSDYQGDYNGLRIREFYHRDGTSSMLSPIKEMSTSEVLEAQLSYYKHMGSGIDLVPSREKDLLSLTKKYEVTPSVLCGICKFQAVVRGRRVRKLMVTEKAKQLLSTLVEVNKLANQFHTDILTDNIEKGDINFHKALFCEERTARQKLWHLMVELSVGEQLKILRQDGELKQKLNERIAPSHSTTKADASRPICGSSSMPLPQNSKRNQAAIDARKSTKLRIPQRIPISTGGAGIEIGTRRVSSLPPRANRGAKSAGTTRSRSRSPGQDCSKRQPLCPRKNLTASNLPISQRGVVRSNFLRGSGSRKTATTQGKTDAAHKPPVSTGPIARPCHQKNSTTARKPWR